MALDKLQELQEQRNKLVSEMRSLHTENEDKWTDELNQRFDSMSSEVDTIDEQIESVRTRSEKAAKLDALEQKKEREHVETRSEIGEDRQLRAGAPTERQKAMALQGWLRHQSGRELSREHRESIEKVGIGYGPSFDARHQPHTVLAGHGMWSTGGGRMSLPSQYFKRSIATDTEPELIPEGFMMELSRALLDFGGFRRIARIISTSTGNVLPWPTWDDTGNSGVFVDEEASVATFADPTVSEVEFGAYKVSSKGVKVSAELLEDSAFDLASILGEALGTRIGRASATQFWEGDGSTEPEGVKVGASAGVTTVAVDSFTADEVIELQDALDPAWERGNTTGFAMNKSTLTEVRKLKDDNNQYLWQPGMMAGVPDMLLGRPVAVVQEVDDLGTGNVPMVYGDFSQFVIRDAGTSRFYRLEELYRANDQTGFILFSRVDSKVLQSAAIKKLTNA